MRSALLPSLLAGLIAAGLFIAVLMLGLGFLFLFLPSLPLFWLGLSGKSKEALQGAALATLVISAVIDLSTGFFFLLLVGLPTIYISYLALLSRDNNWFPVGLIFTRLTFYAAGMLSLVACFYFLQGDNLEQIVAGQIHEEFAHIDSDYASAVNALAGGYSFLIFSMSLWLWGLALYAHAWFVNRQLAAKKKNIRPDFAIQPFLPPNELLYLLALSAFATLAASPPLAYVGKILLLGLLLPYFFLGASLMHQAAKTWPSRRFFLFFVYLLAATAFWPALILALWGLAHHIKHLSGKPN